jgi:hypothetical protein
MTTMNPYYANESSVGAVFDVAHFSRFKALKMAVVGFVFAALVGVAAVYVWNPDWLLPRPPSWFADANQDVKDLARQHPLGLKIGVGVAALFALIFAAASLSCIVNAYSGAYFIRVGENGLSLRLPDTFFSTFERDIDWSQVDKLTVVQEKYVGSLSRNAGNIGGELRLRTHDGLNRALRLDCFREDAWLIHQRIEEAMNTQAAVLA